MHRMSNEGQGEIETEHSHQLEELVQNLPAMLVTAKSTRY